MSFKIVEPGRYVTRGIGVRQVRVTTSIMASVYPWELEIGDNDWHILHASGRVSNNLSHPFDVIRRAVAVHVNWHPQSGHSFYIDGVEVAYRNLRGRETVFATVGPHRPEIEAELAKLRGPILEVEWRLSTVLDNNDEHSLYVDGKWLGALAQSVRRNVIVWMWTPELGGSTELGVDLDSAKKSVEQRLNLR